MTTRLKGVVVTFDRDVREDDAKAIVLAIRMIKNVQNVMPIEAKYEDTMIAGRVKRELTEKIYKALE